MIGIIISDFLINTYSVLCSQNGTINKLLRPFRGFVLLLSNWCIPWLFRYGKKNRKKAKCKKNVVVSLTTFPARIEKVDLVIRSLLNQVVCPWKIILWLSRDQFGSKEGLPTQLKSLQNDIFEIRIVNGDIRSHKKFFYSFEEFWNSIIILVDDDIFYPSTMVRDLLNEHESHPKAIVCRYARRIKVIESVLAPYSSWVREIGISSDNNIFFGSGGGTLLMPQFLYKDVCNQELFMNLTPMADDIWLNAMVRLAKLEIRKIKSQELMPITESNGINLSSGNIGSDLNDKQIQAVVDYYSNNMFIPEYV